MATVRPVPALVNDLVEEILLRFPPDDPVALVRTALVSKCWRRLVSGLRFRRRFREVHGTAPMLGFFRQHGALFQPTTSFCPRFAGKRRGTICWAVDARHGRVLINRYSSPDHAQGVFLVWDPITGDLQTLPRPPLLPSCRRWTAALVCAAAGRCDHLDCAGGHFRVVFMGTRYCWPLLASVFVYSSEVSVWSDELTTVQHRYPIGSGAALVGNAVYFWFEGRSGILKHDLDTQMSSIEQTPASVEDESALLTATQDGRLGFAMIQQSKLSLWSRGACLDRDAGWEQNRVIELSILLPATSSLSCPPQLVAFADGIGATVMVQTVDGLFAIDLKSSHVREIEKSLKLYTYDIVPFVSFCTPALGAASSGVEPIGSASTASQS